MESPVRICIGAALVVNLLLLSGTSVNGLALPTPNATSTTVRNEKLPRFNRNNGTILSRSRLKSSDDSINELNPKDATIEEHAEKNAKYKDRGRVRYQTLLKSSTESSLRRARSTEASKLVIVTPTAETKKIPEIIDSMRTFKKTKLPVISTSTTPVTFTREVEESEEEESYDDEEEEEEKDDFSKFSSNKYDFFTIPTYGDDFIHDTDAESSDNKVKNDYSSPSYGGFSSLFPDEPSYGYKDTTHDIFKSESFFSFDSDLTTPKNDFFDKKFQSISTSIINKLDTIKTPPGQNTTNTNVHKIIHENVDMEKVGNNTPSNKSSVFIKNTKEIRLLDNDGASSAANKELSDVQGTSIYYEMSVLSTETYNIDSDDDCDPDTLVAEPTVGTSSEQELVPTKPTNELKPVATSPTIVDSVFENLKSETKDLKSNSVKQETADLKYVREKVTLPDEVKKSENLTIISSTSETIKSKPENKRRTPVSKIIRNKSRLEQVKSTQPAVDIKPSSFTNDLESENPTSVIDIKSFKNVKHDDSTIADLRVASTANPIYPNPTFESIQPTYSIKSNIADTLSFQTVRPTFPDPAFETAKPILPDPIPERILSTDFTPISSVLPIINSVHTLPESTQSVITSTEQTTKHYSRVHTRNRSYSKRLNFNGSKDSPNSVTSKIAVTTPSPRVYTRKFHYSTPRTKPVWMAPRRNVTKPYVRPTYPTTIYSEHFSIADKYKNKSTTIRPKPSHKTVLTTISSDIDPVLQNDVIGSKKTVQSQTITDNAVPSLWKRGSTKFASTTLTSSEVETDEGEWQIPPTSTAWALASLRSPPPSPNTNSTATQKTNENVMQTIKNETNDTATTTTPSAISNDIIPKKVLHFEENSIALQTTSTPLSTVTSETQSETLSEIKSERIPAESNISIQSSVEPVTTTTEQSTKTENSWVPVTYTTETKSEQNEIPQNKTKLIGFESITKLPGSVTPPQDETVAGSEVNQTETAIKTNNDYEITTIRFSYVPTEEMQTETVPTETVKPNAWRPIFPTRTKLTTETPVTTYRPKYATTTESTDASTTIIIETTSQLEVSSQVLENTMKLQPLTTVSPSTSTNMPVTTEVLTEYSPTVETTTEQIILTTQPEIIETTTHPTTIMVTAEPVTTKLTTQQTYIPNTTLSSTTDEVEDYTTIVVEVVTEINTEKEKIITSTTVLPETTETPPNEIHETDCTDVETDVTPETTNITTTEMPTTTTEITEQTTTMASPIYSPTVTPTKTSVEETSTPTTKPDEPTTTEIIEETTRTNAKIQETTTYDSTTDSSYVTRAVGDLEDTTGYTGEVTTKASSITLNEEDTGSGAAIAIAVSTIGVIALVLLIGLLLVVRRRGRRGVYAQRCTPVSLDAYSMDSVSVGHRKGNHRLRASKRSYGNPAYDDEVTSHPMQYAALANFALDVESMSAEFSEIPSVTVRPDEVPPGCEDKNRYSNVLPLPETRVPLRRIGNDPTTEYINANYITGPGNIRNYYIAAQAPLSNTVVDFWRMIWEQNSRLIVMLTEYMENGIEKCYEYLPPSEISDNKRIFGEFKIILKKREQRDKYAVSSVQLINLTTRTWREVTHLWYFWPAKGVPDDYDSVIDFMCEMRSYMKISQTAKEYDEEGVEVIYGDQSRSSFSNLSKLREEGGSGGGLNVYSPARAEESLRRTPNNGTLGRLKAASEVEGIRPCVVTCASGAGRSAALIALDICARALHSAADVPRVVRHLRAQRPHSLSNRHHYIFVYKVLSEYGHKVLGGGMDTI